MKKKWSLFISGTGSNLANVLEMQRELLDRFVVVTSSSTAQGILRAKRNGAHVIDLNNGYLEPKDLAGPNAKKSSVVNYLALDAKLRYFGVDRIFLAGFLKILPKSFVTKWEGKIFNIHPSCLPSYPGLHSIAKAYHDSAKLGVTIHEVDQGVDTGRILLQNEILDSPLGLEEAEVVVHLLEHRMLRKVFRADFFEGIQY